MSVTPFLLYLATWSLVALTPGPAVIFAMTQATRFGFRPALVGIAGIQFGHLILFGCVASGLLALLAATTTSFYVIRILGGLYLFALGARILVATMRAPTPGSTAEPAPTRHGLLMQGIAIQVTNPKALLFMVALVPQFIQPEYALMPQLALLLAITIVVDVCVLSAYAYFAQRGTQSLRAAGITVWIERTFGAALVYFGIRLLIAALK